MVGGVSPLGFGIAVAFAVNKLPVCQLPGLRMFQFRKIMSIVVVAALCVHASADEPNSGVRDSESAVGQLQAMADAKRDLAQATYDRQRQRVEAIERLQEHGHATFRELTIAKVEQLRLGAQLKSAEALSGFVAKAATESGKPDRARRGNGVTATFVVNIPSLDSDPRTQLLSAVVLNVTNDADLVDEVRDTVINHVTTDHQSRTKAWTELCERLASIQDGSVSIKNEHTIALLDRKLAMAESRFATLRRQTIRECDQIDTLSIDGQTIASVKGLVAAIKTEADRLHYVALQDMADSQIELIVEWNRRVEIAAQKGASPRSELPMLGRMMASTKHQSLFAGEMLQSISAARKSRNMTMVTVDSAAKPQRTLGMGQDQLNSIRGAAVDRMMSAANEVQITEKRLAHVSQAYRNLARLAKRDAYFVREVGRAKLDLKVAEATVKNAVFQHRQRVLENDYINARIDSHSDIDSMKSLSELLQAQSESIAEQNLAQAQLDKEQWRADGLSRLYETGAATWKELTGARVRCDELHEAIARAKTHRVASGLAAKLIALPSTASVNEQNPTTQSTPNKESLTSVE